MKHAGAAALDRLEPLLESLRKQSALKERSRGSFYRGSRAFLHFHEHGEDLFADVRLTDDFERLRVTTAAERSRMLGRIRTALRDDGTGRKRR